jgi:hypothetical protein
VLSKNLPCFGTVTEISYYRVFVLLRCVSIEKNYHILLRQCLFWSGILTQDAIMMILEFLLEPGLTYKTKTYMDLLEDQFN